LRRVLVVVYALLLVTMALEGLLPPLLPTLREDFGLSTIETGVLLSTSLLCMAVVSIPAGTAAERVGAAPITLVGGCLIWLSALVQAFARDFWPFLGGRALFGVGFGLVWTAGVAWVSDRPTGQAAALGGTTAVAGLGFVIGPALGGTLAERFDPSVPFLVIAVAAGAATVATVLVPRRAAAKLERHEGLLHTLPAARREPRVAAAVVLVLLSGLAIGTVNLLLPLALDGEGLSSGEVGTVFSAMAAVFVLVSTAVARLGERVSTVFVGGAGLLASAAVFTFPIFTGAAALLVVFLLLRGSMHAVLATITYPLAVAGAAGAGLRAGAVVALVNVGWSLSGTVGPLAAGAVAEAAGTRGAFTLLVALYAAAGVWMLAAERRSASPARLSLEPCSPDEPAG
jgi:MFS family permease